MNDVQYFDRKNHLETPRTFLGYKMKPKTTYIYICIYTRLPSIGVQWAGNGDANIQDRGKAFSGQLCSSGLRIRFVYSTLYKAKHMLEPMCFWNTQQSPNECCSKAHTVRGTWSPTWNHYGMIVLNFFDPALKHTQNIDNLVCSTY